MVTVIGVRFKKAGKVYYFDPSDVWPKPGEYVVVETARGVEMGEVVTGAREVDDEQIVAPLKKVVRMASEDDIQRMEFNERREKEAYHIAHERIIQHKLDMKLVDVEYTFDSSKIIFYFTANGRVDFRDLVKDLASVFKMRIELRQIGVRDEAKMLGGLGSCGRQICCGAFLGDFQPVSIKMAKEQNLSLNPTKISGQCGRLMCCLKYEQDYYETALKRLPKIGRECVTPDGAAIIQDINVIREKVRVRLRTAEDAIEIREYALEEVSKPQHTDGQQQGSGEAAKQRAIENNRKAAAKARREAKEAADSAKQAGKDGKDKKDPQDQQEKQKQRRILSKSKGKQLSTEQYFDKVTFENTGAPAQQQQHATRKKDREDKKDRPPRQDRPKDEVQSGFSAGIPKSTEPAIRPGDPMDS